ncbi:MAG TPA: MarR family transcriptional regulator [Pseudonocardia sp.]|jgi:DNA-binding MarR family transcriptional regulator|nr:MarR family transcriptional regulator [Pseudonocardia sp.]
MGIDVDDIEISRAADALFLAMRRARGAAAEAGGLTLAQLALLEPLADGEGLAVNAVAAKAGVSPPTATRMLRQLGERGMVRRERSDHDERLVVVTLTGAGADAVVRLREQRRTRQAAAFAAFTPQERTQLVSLMTRLASLVEGSST